MAERPAHSRHSKSGVPAPPRGPPPPRTGESTLKKVPASTNLKRAKASEHHHHNNKVDTSHVPRNSKGGVLVSEEEIEAAFRFLDVHGTGRVTLHNLKKRLSLIYKGLPPSQYKLLLGEGKSEMTLKDLKDLLLDNTVDNFDPVAEAYKVYDPEDSGGISPSLLHELFHGLELAKLTDEDMVILMDAADVDRDGRIGLSDFRKLSDAAKQHREQQQQQAKAAAEAKKRQPPPPPPQQLLPMVRAPSSGSDKGNNQAEEQDELA